MFYCPHDPPLETTTAGEPNTKDSLLIAGDKLPLYLAGAYTLGDALADLCEVPQCRAQLLKASRSVSQQQQQQQRVLLESPFARASAAAASGAIDIVSPPSAAGASDAGGGEVEAAVEAQEEEEQAAAALAASVRVPRGFAIGSFSSKSLGGGGSGGLTGVGGSNPSLLQLLEREKQQLQQQQQQQQQKAGVRTHASASTPAGTGAAAAKADSDDLQSGAPHHFADEYLDPPMPTADQLSLFTEVQRFVGRKRLRPVLHCMLHRMVFAMPFDNSVRVTLDTDVRTTALVSV